MVLEMAVFNVRPDKRQSLKKGVFGSSRNNFLHVGLRIPRVVAVSGRRGSVFVAGSLAPSGRSYGRVQGFRGSGVHRSTKSGSASCTISTIHFHRCSITFRWNHDAQHPHADGRDEKARIVQREEHNARLFVSPLMRTMRPVDRQLSFELGTLDQLLSGDMTLSVIRQVFPDDSAFLRGVSHLMIAGDVILLKGRAEVTEWRWRALFDKAAVTDNLQQFMLRLTDQGARRIA